MGDVDFELKDQTPAAVSLYSRLCDAVDDFRLRYRVLRFMDGRFNRSFLSQPVVTEAYFPYFWMVRVYMWWHAYDDGRSYMNFAIGKRCRVTEIKG